MTTINRNKRIKPVFKKTSLEKTEILASPSPISQINIIMTWINFEYGVMHMFPISPSILVLCTCSQIYRTHSLSFQPQTIAWQLDAFQPPTFELIMKILVNYMSLVVVMEVWFIYLINRLYLFNRPFASIGRISNCW